jgi:hypothetical protein
VPGCHKATRAARVCHRAGIFGPRVPQGQNGPVLGALKDRTADRAVTRYANSEQEAGTRGPGHLFNCLTSPASGPVPYSVHQSSSLAWPSPVGPAGRGAEPFPAGRETGADATGALSTACLGGVAATAGSMFGI